MRRLNFRRGTVDNNLYVFNSEKGQLITIVYVDDIIFGGDHSELCQDFAQKMSEEFEMSLIREMTYFLGLQIK